MAGARSIDRVVVFAEAPVSGIDLPPIRPSCTFFGMGGRAAVWKGGPIPIDRRVVFAVTRQTGLPTAKNEHSIMFSGKKILFSGAAIY